MLIGVNIQAILLYDLRLGNAMSEKKSKKAIFSLHFIGGTCILSMLSPNRLGV